MSEQQLLELLSDSRDGMTAIEAASVLQKHPQSIGSMLSKMFLYGKINRRRDPAQRYSPLVYFAKTP